MAKDTQKLSKTKRVKKKEEKIEKTTKESLEKNTKPKRYWEAVGRRKTATCRVRIFPCRPFDTTKERPKITVNDKPYYQYFPTLSLQKIVEGALSKMKSLGRFEVTVKVKGGGIKGQAEAIRHGIARALVKFNPDFKKRLKRAGYLTRDPRMKERKKPGLKKARRARQWRKR
ncbi:30S ribosomal protein S9 [bacterium]|nr:30S ribosomal protein S9 [bacterium]